jgi:hypothetical protein
MSITNDEIALAEAEREGDRSQPAHPVKKVSSWDLINRRLSPMQRAIIGVLNVSVKEAFPRGMHSTGQVIAAIGRQPDSKSYASVSRSLDRLARAGLVEIWHAHCRLQGSGYRYALTEFGVRIKEGMAEATASREARS